MSRKTNSNIKDNYKYSFAGGSLSNISFIECQSRWIETSFAIPACDKKLLIVNDSGNVIPGWYKAEQRIFLARLTGANKTPLRPKAWRLYPSWKDKEPKVGTTLKIYMF